MPRPDRSVAALALGLGVTTVASACDGTGIGPLPDPAPDGAPGEVRGLRLTPGPDSVTVRFLDAPGADSYVLCWNTEPAPEFGDCVHEVTSPHTQKRLEPGERLYWAVVPENEAGYGPIVETPSAVPGEADRPLAVHIDMDRDDVAELYTRDVTSNERLPARVSLGDEHGPWAEVPDVRGVRFRGESSRHQDRKSFHLRLDSRPTIQEFPEFNFRGLGRRGGNRVLLNQTWTDPTGIRPALALEMFEEVGLPAPSTFFADLWLNGIYEGFYVGVERVDREALRGWLLNHERGEFTLVRDRTRQHRHLDEINRSSMFSLDPDRLGDTDEEQIAFLQRVFDYRGDLEDHDWEELHALLRWVHDTKTETAREWRRGLEERVHIESMIDLLALYLMQDDFDSFADDYWLYRDGVGDELWRFIPWDQERTFGNRFWFGTSAGDDTFPFDGDVTDGFSNPLFERTLEVFADEIHARVRELYDETFTEAWFDERIRDLAAQAEASMTRWPEPAFTVHPQQEKTPPGWFDWHIETLRDYQAFRRQFLTAEPAPGKPYTHAGEIELGDRGTGWVSDPHGRVLLRLDGEPGDSLDLDVQLKDTPRRDGLGKDWVIENRGEPWRGDVTLYFRNQPFDTWLPELHETGRAWELTVLAGRDDWLPTRVNPYANAVTAQVLLEGERTLTARFRR